MFTGIVEELGRVVESDRTRVKVEAALAGLKKGDSVAINGVCLTVVKLAPSRKGHHLEFEMSLETLSRTSLGLLKEGDAVNLERPLTLGAFVGGHLVTGHVDASVLLMSKKSSGEGCMTVRFELPKTLSPFVAVKGSIAVDGVSLTVTKVGKHFFETVLIPHTLKHSTLGEKAERDLCHIEVDILARYVSHYAEARKS